MAGYSNKPLYLKLGLKATEIVYIKNAPANYIELIAPISQQLMFRKRISKEIDFVHFFTKSKSELQKFLPIYKDKIKSNKDKIKSNGMIWVSWPKKASKVVTDVTEDTIREVCLPLGLVDIKVCAVDETWSGLKLVIHKELRKT